MVNFSNKFDLLKLNTEGRVEELKETIEDLVCRPEVRLHYDINKHRV
jgi:hypothetical protein